MTDSNKAKYSINQYDFVEYYHKDGRTNPYRLDCEFPDISSNCKSSNCKSRLHSQDLIGPNIKFTVIIVDNTLNAIANAIDRYRIQITLVDIATDRNITIDITNSAVKLINCGVFVTHFSSNVNKADKADKKDSYKKSEDIIKIEYDDKIVTDKIITDKIITDKIITDKIITDKIITDKIILECGIEYINTYMAILLGTHVSIHASLNNLYYTDLGNQTGLNRVKEDFKKISLLILKRKAFRHKLFLAEKKYIVKLLKNMNMRILADNVIGQILETTLQRLHPIFHNAIPVIDKICNDKFGVSVLL